MVTQALSLNVRFDIQQSHHQLQDAHVVGLVTQALSLNVRFNIQQSHHQLQDAQDVGLVTDAADDDFVKILVGTRIIYNCSHFYLTFHGKDIKKFRRTAAKVFKSEPNHGKMTFSEIQNGRKSENKNHFILKSIKTAMYTPTKFTFYDHHFELLLFILFVNRKMTNEMRNQKNRAIFSNIL